MNAAIRPVTLAHVAALAGVSAKTVSRVVNRDPNVSAETRRRIEIAIAETGFRPNPAARSLAASRSYLIGIFMSDTAAFYHAELYRGAARACRALGFHLVLEEFDENSPRVVEQYERGLRFMRCDGMVLPPPLSDDTDLLDALDRDGVRYVRLAPARNVDRSTAIFADDADGVAALARHLWELGHRRFGIVAGPIDHAATAIRRDTFIASIIAAGGSADDVLVVDGAWDGSLMLAGRNAAMALLDRPTRPGAIFAFNDEIAAGVMNYAREIGIGVPDDLAVAGFDDSDAAMLTWPSLTTVRQPVAGMGARAVEAIAAAEATIRIDCPVSLVIRGSTRPERDGTAP